MMSLFKKSRLSKKSSSVDSLQYFLSERDKNACERNGW